MKKLNSRRGETLIEVLVSMLIISLALLMLSGAIITSARLNKKAGGTETFVSKNWNEEDNISVRVEMKDHSNPHTYSREGASSGRSYYYE